MRRILLLLCLLLVATVIGLGVLWSRISHNTALAAVTVVSSQISPETAATDLPTATATFTATASDSPTSTASPTASPTASDTPTPTATLAVRLLHVTAINPGVALGSALPTHTPVATMTSTSLATINVPLPPADMPRAVFTPALLTPVGWVRYKDTDAEVVYTGQWTGFNPTYRAIDHHYTYSDDLNATATFRFVGAGIQVRYVLSKVGGIFELRLDGQVLSTVDSYTANPYGDFASTAIYDLVPGWHTIQIINTVHKETVSAGHVIGLDAIEIYKVNPPATVFALTPSPAATLSQTPSPAPAAAIQLVVAPPTVQPTVTALSPGVIDISLTIGYDANGNKVLDPNEGAAGISVRVVSLNTNHVVAAGVTDDSGYVHLQALQTGKLMMVIPYLGKSWALSPSPNQSSTTSLINASYSVTYTLLVPPVNQPALIP